MKHYIPQPVIVMQVEQSLLSAIQHQASVPVKWVTLEINAISALPDTLVFQVVPVGVGEWVI